MTVQREQPGVSSAKRPANQWENFVIISSRSKKMATGAAAIATAAMMVSSSPARAQETEVQALRRQIEELSARLEKIEADNKKQAEAKEKAAAAAKAAPAVTTKSPVVISGLLQVQSLNYFSQSGSGNNAPNTFRLRRGELRLTAPRITDRISGTVMFDPAKATSTRGAGFGETASNTIRARDNILQEIQISYLLKKAREGSKDNAYIDFGQFKIPVGYESLQSSSGLPLVERALIFTQRDPFDGGYGDVRDTGIQLRGTQSKFDYRLGIFNGFGDRQNTLAISDAKAFLGQLAYHPNSALTFGVSGGTGNTGFRNTGSLLEGPRSKRNIFNTFAAYKKNKLSLQAEYLQGKAQGITAITAGVPTTSLRDISGYYGSVAYAFSPKIEGVFRYDYLNADRNGSGDTSVRDLILGLNYYIKGNNAKIQANLIRRNGASDLAFGSSNPASDIRDDRTELRLQGQVAF